MLIIGGAHLSRFYGETYREVLADKINISYMVDFLLDSDNPNALAKSCGVAVISIAQIFSSDLPDIIIILGDRHELLSIAINALLFRIPIIHIAGGEITTGAIDEQVRHAITKISHVHIAQAREYAENISKMGEEDWRIQILGSPSVENLQKLELLNRKELSEELGIDENLPIILVTYHPVTLEINIGVQEQIYNLLKALEKFEDHQIIFTFPGAEHGSTDIVNALLDFASKHKHIHIFKNLGTKLYFSVMKHSSVVVGNSSSGIIEAPSLGVPTVNIGNRQKGRIAARSVIHCGYESRDIEKALQKALYDKTFKSTLKNVKNPYDPYGDGMFSKRLLKIIDNIEKLDRSRLLIKKLDFSVKPEEWNSLLTGSDQS